MQWDETIKDIFKAYDIRGLSQGDNPELTAEVARSVGRGLADFLPATGKVVVGRDMRNDSEELQSALIAGLCEQGRDVIDIGLVSTDMIYFATGHLKTAGGAMVTASHNPGKYNGIKLCGKGVVPIGMGRGLEKIKASVLANKLDSAVKQGKVERVDIRKAWVKHTLGFIDVDRLKPFKLAIDAGNGMAGINIPLLAANTKLKIEAMYDKLDGTFPNHPANPIILENVADIIRKTKENNLDLGIAFDGDGDRAVLIDDKHRPVPPAIMGAILAEHYLAKQPGATVVYDAGCSHIVPDIIEKHGGTAIRSRVGHSNIKALMHAHKAIFGCEQSAHYYFKDNFYADSGLISAIVVLGILSDSPDKLSEMVDQLSVYANSGEINLPVGDTETKLRELQMAYSDGAQDELDGLTVEYPTWWFNVRASNTEPLLRLSVESKDPVLTQEKVEELTKILNY